jgi:glycerol-1-phosphate dehydrogenase [NAD(P)+]
MMLDNDLIAGAVARSAAVAEVCVGSGVLAGTGAIFRRVFGPGPALLVADENTWAAAGRAVEGALHAEGIATERLILPALPRPKPSVELGTEIAGVLAQQAGTPVAIGSGVLNDLVKYAAFRLDRPYLCIATAASMDGYTSAGSPLSERGFKKTIPCRPARAVIGDLAVIAAAPPAMIGWGYGDLAGKVPAGGDWMIADALGVEPIDAVAWPMVQDGLAGWLARPDRIAAGDPAEVAGLFTGLTLVGLAMEAHGSSRPASGADHQIAHLWEMEDLSQGGERVSHGACVAVGCAATLALYDWLLAQDLTRLGPVRAPGLDEKIALIRAAFGAGEIADRSTEETRAKHLDQPALDERLAHLRAIWPDLAPRLRARLLTAPQMQARLRAAGAPARAADIGLGTGHLRRTVANAVWLRSRYTVLDLLLECGLLGAAIDAAFPPDGT